MGTPHYHPCTGDCPNGLTAGYVARSAEPEPAAVRGEPYEPSDPADWTPGAGWERLKREMPHVIPAVITDEDMRTADEIIARSEATTDPAAEAFIAAFKQALDRATQLVLPPSQPTRAEIRAAVFAELRESLAALVGTAVRRPHYGDTYVVHEHTDVVEWLDRQERIEREERRGRL